MDYTIFRADGFYFVPIDMLSFDTDEEAIGYLQIIGDIHHAEVAVGGGYRIVSFPKTTK